MWVPSISSPMLSIPIIFSKANNDVLQMFTKFFLMYLQKHLHLFINTPQTIMSTYFLMVDAPTLNQFTISIAPKP
jgi:hypothetical protein